MGGYTINDTLWAAGGVIATVVSAAYKRKTTDIYARLFDAISQQIDLA